MARPLIQYARELALEPIKFAHRFNAPVLIWNYAGTPGKELPLTTNPGGLKTKRPADGQSVVYEVRKGNHRMNPFSFGVTVGRIEANDVAIEDGSVSRFHAYLQQADKGWVVCDAESRNGTFLREVKLEPNVKTPLEDGAVVRFGDIPLQFLLPASFITRLRLLSK